MAGTGAAWFRARTGNARAIGAPPAPGWLGLERAVRHARTPPAPGSPGSLDCHPRRDGRERARGGDARAKGRAASVARERVREDSRPFTAQRVRYPLRSDRTVHIIFWLDLTVIGLAGDVALLGARGLIQESYIEKIPRIKYFGPGGRARAQTRSRRRWPPPVASRWHPGGKSLPTP